MNTMTYKGYFTRVDYDDDDATLIGHLVGIKDVIGFHAEDVPTFRLAFEEAVDDYIETCQKIGKSPEKPYSGKVMFRIDPEIHRSVALAAQLEGISLNQWAERTLKQAAIQVMEGGIR